MSAPLALADAQRRLGKPGRPPLSAEEKARRAAKSAESQRRRRADQLAAVVPRLLDVDGAARYASLSSWTIREMVSSGKLPRVVVPTVHGRDLRVIRIDRQDLDMLIVRWKDGTP